jgi:hypothetical protein
MASRRSWVPTVLGQSEQARAVKNQRAAPLDWDLGSVLEAAREVAGTEAAEVMAAVAEWADA